MEDSDNSQDIGSKRIWPRRSVRKRKRKGNLATLGKVRPLRRVKKPKKENNTRLNYPRQYNAPLFRQVYESFGFEKSERLRASLNEVTSEHTFMMTKLLQRAVMKRDYSGSCYILAALAFTPGNIPELLWRLGMEVLARWNVSSKAKVATYSNLMFDLCKPHRSEIMLEGTFYRLERTGDLNEGYQYLSDKVNPRKQQGIVKETLPKAYLGLLEYIFWKTDLERKKVKSTLDASDDSDASNDGNLFMPVTQERCVERYGQKALNSLRVIEGKDGNWDIFITKYVELLHYHKQYQKAVSVLREYRNRNLDNPNAHRYFYWYMKNTGAEEEDLLDVLRLAVKADPSSELVKEILVLKKEQEFDGERLQLLFERLDFASNRDSETEWVELDRALGSDLSESADIKVRALWSSRKDWWPQFHLRDHVTMEDGEALKKVKKRVLECLTKFGTFS